jgi:hypothetical protein
MCDADIEFSSLFYLPNFLKKKRKMKCTVSINGAGDFVLPQLGAQIPIPL